MATRISTRQLSFDSALNDLNVSVKVLKNLLAKDKIVPGTGAKKMISVKELLQTFRESKSRLLDGADEEKDLSVDLKSDMVSQLLEDIFTLESELELIDATTPVLNPVSETSQKPDK
ncbi:Hypothetical predicted protein, partial [Paramuricea clavata]